MRDALQKILDLQFRRAALSAELSVPDNWGKSGAKIIAEMGAIDDQLEKLVLLAEVVQFIDETMDELLMIDSFEKVRWFPNKHLTATVRRVFERLDNIRNYVFELVGPR